MSDFQNISAVLFDLDGTLIDSAPDLASAVDKMRLVRNLPSLPYEQYRPMAGAGARGMLGVAFNIAPDDHRFADMREEFFLNYEASLTTRTYAFQGVPELLQEIISRELRWGVVTNKAERFSLPLTRNMKIFSNMSVVISGDTTPHSKPHPAPLLEAARRLNLPPEQCLYVGDDERDIVAGLAAGMRTVAATYGYLGKNSDVKTWGANAVIESPLELISLLAA